MKKRIINIFTKNKNSYCTSEFDPKPFKTKPKNQ